MLSDKKFEHISLHLYIPSIYFTFFTFHKLSVHISIFLYFTKLPIVFSPLSFFFFLPLPLLVTIYFPFLYFFSFLFLPSNFYFSLFLSSPFSCFLFVCSTCSRLLLPLLSFVASSFNSLFLSMIYFYLFFLPFLLFSPSSSPPLAGNPERGGPFCGG